MNQPDFNSAGAMPDRVVLLNGEPHLFFSGTAYLCMNHNPAFTALIAEGMQLYGTNYGSSRSGNFRLSVYEEAEAEMALRFQSPATLTVSSGYLAGQLVIREYEGNADFIYAPDSHPALFRTKQDYSVGSYEDWAALLPERVAGYSTDRLVIVCNAVDPLKAVLHNFSWVERLPTNKSITILVDDSHGLGITGQKGEGIYAQLKDIPNADLVVVSSLGKAMGLPGGVIISSSENIQQFRKSPYYTAASPITPAYLHAFLNASALYEAERMQLGRNIHQFQSKIGASTDFQWASGYPVTYCRNNELAAYLLKQKIFISCFAYPTPSDETITRIILNSHHTREDIDALVTAIQSI